MARPRRSACAIRASGRQQPAAPIPIAITSKLLRIGGASGQKEIDVERADTVIFHGEAWRQSVGVGLRARHKLQGADRHRLRRNLKAGLCLPLIVQKPFEENVIVIVKIIAAEISGDLYRNAVVAYHIFSIDDAAELIA